jgi:hypothetical protein
MLKLKVISFFLCLLLTMQMLPVQQIGRMLSSNQWTEELPHSTDDGSGKEDLSLQKLFLPPSSLTGTSIRVETKALAYIHFSSQIPSNHSTDVVSPPPDILA